MSRLLINPDIQATKDFEGWYIQHVALISFFIVHAGYMHLTAHMLLSLYVLGTLIPKGMMNYFDFVRTRTLRM